MVKKSNKSLNRLKRLTTPKLKPWSIRLITLAFASLLFVFGLSLSGIINVSSYIIPVALILSPIILFIEISALKFIKMTIKDKGKNLIKTIHFLTAFELIVAFALLIYAILNIASISIPILTKISGWLLLAVSLANIFETFAR